jgi:hypothetical protein
MAAVFIACFLILPPLFTLLQAEFLPYLLPYLQ